MFFHKDLKGNDLPPKTLCMTYDDGPGPHTLELGRYLFAEGIRAAFFVIGRHAEEKSDVVAQLSAWGHPKQRPWLRLDNEALWTPL
jgi:peptidoglycan/xylan/chitin deacetylase (PgdA/CDA1 family)